MGRLPRAIRRLTNDELIGECLPKRPILEIFSDNRVYIERHLGVYEYNNTEMQIGVCFGKVVIRGEHLTLASMTKESLVVTGKIRCVEFVRNDAYEK